MGNMNKLSELDNQIRTIKTKLHNLITCHNYNMLHPEIIELSQMLDQLILEYTKLINKTST